MAERSGFDYAEGDFMNKVHQDVIDKFNNKKNEIVSILMKELLRKTKKETNIPVENVKNALKDRVLVYSGGGSTFHFLTKAIHTFTDIRTIDPSIWNEENIKEKALVSKWSVLLTTSYGLALSVSDGDVKLKSLSSIFSHLSKEHEITREEISKDQC